MKTNNSILVRLIIFLGSADLDEFIKIYGENLGNHFWNKFSAGGKFNYTFLRELSNNNLIILENYLKNEVTLWKKTFTQQSQTKF